MGSLSLGSLLGLQADPKLLASIALSIFWAPFGFLLSLPRASSGSRFFQVVIYLLLGSLRADFEL